MKWHVHYLLLILVAPCLATDIHRSDGTALHNADVIRREHDGITYLHAGGITKVLFRELPREERKEFTDLIYEDEGTVLDFNYPKESPLIQRILLDAGRESLCVVQGKVEANASLTPLSGAVVATLETHTYLLHSSVVLVSDRDLVSGSPVTCFVEPIGVHTSVTSREAYLDIVTSITSRVTRWLTNHVYTFNNNSAVITLDADHPLADGEAISVLAVRSGVYAIPSVDGSTRRLAHYMQISPSAAARYRYRQTEETVYPLYREVEATELDEAAFVQWLKDGEILHASAPFKTPCTACDGTGREVDPNRIAQVSVHCPTCRGRGSLYQTVDNVPERTYNGFSEKRVVRLGTVQSTTKTISSPCPTCLGTGQVNDHHPLNRACGECNGQGFVRAVRPFVCRWQD